MHQSIRIAEAVARLKTVFLEIPGTQLSVADASRMAGLDRNTCQLLLEALEDVRFLTRSRHGLFACRHTDSPKSD